MKKAVILILITLSALSALHAGEKRVVTLSEFIDKSFRNNPDVFSQLMRLKESEAAEIQALAVYNAVLNIHYNHMVDNPFTAYQSIKITEITTDNFGTNLQWIVPYLGTRLKAGFEYSSNSLSINTPPFPQSASYYQPEISVEIQQPLLRNWLGIIDRFPITQAKFNRMIMKESVDDAVETILIDLYNMYFEWLHLYGQVNTFENSVKNSEALLYRTTQRFKTGISDRSDLSKIKVMNLEYLKSRELAVTRYGVMTRKIYRWYSGRDVSDIPEIVPESEPALSVDGDDRYNIDAARKMRILRLTRDLLYEQLKTERSGLLPDLNFIFSYKFRNYDQSSSNAFNEFNYNNYTVGLNLNYPLGSSSGRGKVKDIESKIRKWDSDAASFERNYRYSYIELVKISGIYKKILDYDRMLIEQARIQLYEEEKKYMQGRADLFFVVQYRNTLLSYELIHLRDFIESNKTRLQLLGLLNKIYRR